MLHRKSKLFFFNCTNLWLHFLAHLQQSFVQWATLSCFNDNSLFYDRHQFPSWIPKVSYKPYLKNLLFSPSGRTHNFKQGEQESQKSSSCGPAFLWSVVYHYSACRGFSPAVPWGFSERPIHSAGAFWCCFAANAILKATVKWHRLILSWVKTMKQGRGLFQCTQ